MSLRSTLSSFLFASALPILLSGCAFAKRSPEMYSKDTTKLIQTKSGELKACYDRVLKDDEATRGSVTVFFILEKDTGVIKDIEVKDSSVPPEIQSCVEAALQGLVLRPGDADEGHATITFVFEPGPKPPAPPAPPAPAAAPPPAPAEKRTTQPRLDAPSTSRPVVAPTKRLKPDAGP